MTEPSDQSLKRILIIANLFKSSPRIPRLIRYLPALGWLPTVVTPRMSGNLDKIFNAPPKDLKHLGLEIIEAGESKSYEQSKDESIASPARKPIKNVIDRVDSKGKGRIGSMLNKYYWRFYLTINFPDIDKRWKDDALRAAKKTIAEKKFDVVLSSSSPIISHVIASELKQEFGIPWIAEYRDLWTLNHNYQLGPIMHFFDRRLERKTIEHSDALVTVSDPLVNDLIGMFPDKKIINIPNGFDQNEYPAAIPITKEFTITYTGQIYHGKQDPNLLVESISELTAEGKLDRNKIRLRFYGPVDEELKRFGEQKGIGEILIQPGVVPREEALIRQRESQTLIFLNWDDPTQPGIGSLKLMEYLQARRPIILTGKTVDNLTANIIRDTNAGKLCSSKSEIKETVIKYYDQFKRNGLATFEGKADQIDKYDFRHSARKYARLMNEIITT